MLLRLDRRTHVRCRKCRARRVLPRHPERYAGRLPVCRSPGCGSRDYVADKWMNERNTSPRGTRAMGCTCAGYWFTHRRGSLFCWYRSDGSDRLPGDPDFKSRYDMKETA